MAFHSQYKGYHLVSMYPERTKRFFTEYTQYIDSMEKGKRFSAVLELTFYAF